MLAVPSDGGQLISSGSWQPTGTGLYLGLAGGSSPSLLGPQELRGWLRMAKVGDWLISKLLVREAGLPVDLRECPLLQPDGPWMG